MNFNFMVSPGNILKEYMESNNITQKELAAITESSQRHISNVINGKVKLTEEFALKLEKVFKGVKAEFWMDLEVAHRLHLLRMESSDTHDALEIVRKYQLKHIFKGMELSVKEQITSLLNIMGTSSVKEIDGLFDQIEYSFHEDGGTREAILLWVKLAEQEIELQNDIENLPEFNHDNFLRKFHMIKNLIYTKDFELAKQNIIKYANRLGMLVVFYESIPNAKIRGAVRNYHGRPLILLSDRYKQIDRYYFTLIHELIHIKNNDIRKDKYNITLDDEQEVEELANKQAKEFLIDKELYSQFTQKRNFSEEEIIIFSKKNKVIPGIIVSFLQHDKLIEYNEMNHLKK